MTDADEFMAMQRAILSHAEARRRLAAMPAAVPAQLRPAKAAEPTVHATGPRRSTRLPPAVIAPVVPRHAVDDITERWFRAASAKET